jgi:hypothetical protein
VGGFASGVVGDAAMQLESQGIDNFSVGQTLEAGAKEGVTDAALGLATLGLWRAFKFAPLVTAVSATAAFPSQADAAVSPRALRLIVRSLTTGIDDLSVVTARATAETAKRRAMQQMLRDDLGLSVSERAFYSAPHANSKATLKEAWGYALVSLRTGKVLKYGETTQGFGRYSQAYLRRIGARMERMATGSKAEMHQWQHEKILNHRAIHGKRPQLNKSNY